MLDTSDVVARCEEPCIVCAVVTIPDPDCVVCAHVEGPIVFSTCQSEERGCFYGGRHYEVGEVFPATMPINGPYWPQL